VAAAAVAERVKERVCNSVPVPGAPDGVSVVGIIVVGANVGVGVVGANVGVDVGVGVVGANVGVDVGGGSAVGASVGVAAAHTIASASLQRRRSLPPTARYPEYPHRPVWCAMGTRWFAREPLEDAHASAGYRVEYAARPLSADRVPLACNVHRMK
jgi:hypothetical protein